ncbi:MAG: Mu-like prophage major head subunit gpT family protein [Pseudomonadota bacterium]|nr:Mu-like prophage major head subunit gpT family protein [Pseudomonadota bacterium]MEE3099569.1 Mu-like prophage major head subunit gpT family protein [Pseudomonadota bacterium]
MPNRPRITSRAVIGTFYERLEAAQASSWIDAVSMYFQSDQESEEYAWLGGSPAMREWIGGRHAVGLAEHGMTLKNRKYESTLEIPVDWMRRDKTGQINVRIGEQADRAVQHWASLLSALLINAESAVCYDGQYFFDTDHSEGASGTQSNDITVDISAVAAGVHGTATAPSPEEVRAMVMAGVQQMMGLKDDQGEPANEMARNFLVTVPTTWWTPATTALVNPLLGGGDTNVLTNLDGYNFALQVNPRLTWTDKLAVFRADGQTKAFIRQEEEDITVAAVAEGSELEFEEDVHRYGIKASRAAGYGDWKKAVLVQAV